jgi:hypothetical protein
MWCFKRRLRADGIIDLAKSLPTSVGFLLTLCFCFVIITSMSYYPTTNITVGNVLTHTGITCAAQYAYHPHITTGTSGYSNWSINTSATNPTNTVFVKGNTVQLDADADIKFGEVSLMETLREIKTQMGMLTPDPKLESEFDELQACAEEYERLRTKFLEQKRVWDTLKQQDL